MVLGESMAVSLRESEKDGGHRDDGEDP